ncbi:hypothetical protein NDU88_003096 [Pleurodeles waltl]|uniref:Uncharacterized protein n=1 Tax=Pleurodeles waltl TaxID=8319 RepID=A0AAV7NH99_PLEWA|nr:hypothetical protein NDU88_003096 [Pleurodeles waltl]
MRPTCNMRLRGLLTRTTGRSACYTTHSAVRRCFDSSWGGERADILVPYLVRTLTDIWEELMTLMMRSVRTVGSGLTADATFLAIPYDPLPY